MQFYYQNNFDINDLQHTFLGTCLMSSIILDLKKKWKPEKIKLLILDNKDEANLGVECKMKSSSFLQLV